MHVPIPYNYCRPNKDCELTFEISLHWEMTSRKRVTPQTKKVFSVMVDGRLKGDKDGKVSDGSKNHSVHKD